MTKDDVEITETEGPLDIEAELTKVYRACKNGRLRLDILMALNGITLAKIEGKAAAMMLPALDDAKESPVAVQVAAASTVGSQPLIAPPGYFTAKHDKVHGSVISPEGVQRDFTNEDEFNAIDFIKVKADFLFIENWQLCSSLHGIIQPVCNVVTNSYLPTDIFIKAA